MVMLQLSHNPKHDGRDVYLAYGKLGEKSKEIPSLF